MKLCVKKTAAVFFCDKKYKNLRNLESAARMDGETSNVYRRFRIAKNEEELQNLIKTPHFLHVILFEKNDDEPSKDLHEYFELLSNDLDLTIYTKFYSCNLDRMPEVRKQFSIETTPTVLFFKKTELETVQGADKKLIFQKINEFTEKSVVNASSTNSNIDEVRDRIKSLIENHFIILFMKGTKDQPRCGFSRQITEILNKKGVEYVSYDILDDNDLRQELKNVSKWPTYPQLYIKGQLLGGLDAVNELEMFGQLDDALKGN